MTDATHDRLESELASIREQGLFKTERTIVSPQQAEIVLADGRRVLNFCANNYLGLADHPALIAAAKRALDSHGFGMASVRFSCGTQDLHNELERRISQFFGTDGTILYKKVGPFDDRSLREGLYPAIEKALGTPAQAG